MRQSQYYSNKLSIDASQKTKERDYWLSKLSGNPLKKMFPYDYKHAGETPPVPENIEFEISNKVFEQLMRISNASDLRLFIMLVAMGIQLLYKYTGDKDIMVGAPVNRQETSAELINTILILRNQVTGEETFKELLMRVSRTLAEANEHVNYPMETLLYQLDIPYEPSDDFPLFDIVFLLENIHDRSYIGHIHTNMVFSFLKQDRNIRGLLEYNPLLYKKSTIERLVRHFCVLMENALADVNQPVAEIEILSEPERQRILFDINDTCRNFPTDQSVHRVFEEQAVESPDSIAALVQNGSSCQQCNALTYRQLNRRANRLARLLKARGIQTDEAVGLMVERSLEMIIGILGILKAGAAYLPINPEYPKERIKYIVENSRAPVLLTCKSESEQVTGLGIPRFYFEDMLVPLPGESEENPDLTGQPDNLAYIIYTSGSTGKPKGVMVEHRNLMNLVWGLKERIYDQYPGRLKVSLVAPYVFDASVQQIFATLLLGHSLYIVPENTRVDGAALLEYYKENKIDISDGTPMHLRLMLASLGSQHINLEVKHFLIGGEALPQKTVQAFFTGFEAKTLKITNVYGPAECCVDSTSYEISTENVRQLETVPIGKPMPNVQVYIVDEKINLLPIGVPGQLCISGRGVSRGYLGQEELTEQTFIPNPFNSNENQRLYKTGDLARWLPDGNIEFLGRLDNQVKIRGLRVELGEIENQLLNHRDIKEVLVIMREIPGSSIEGVTDPDSYLYAYFVPAKSGEVDITGLRGYLSTLLPDYMLPTFLVPLEQFPMTANGKIDRKALPGPEIVHQGNRCTPPRNRVEEKLVRIWEEVLNRESGTIGIDTDFFETGGHSLKAAVLITRIHKEMNVKLPLSEVFNHPTIRGLSEYTDAALEDKFTSVNIAEKREYYPVSSAQKRLYILQRMDENNISYNTPVIVILEGPPDSRKLEDTIGSLIARHETLRTSFEMINDDPVQKIHKEIDFEIQYREPGEAESVEDIIRDFIRPFDLSRPGIFRIRVVKTNPTEHVLLIDMHHIITDDNSQEILTREFLALYSGENLTPLKLQYKDFAQWQNKLFASGEIKEQENFWLKEFGTQGEIPVLKLPADFDRPAIQSVEGSSMGFELTTQEGDQLKEMAKQENMTLYMIFIALFNVLLARLSGQEEIIIGTDTAGRRHADLEQIIGMFVNTLGLKNYPAREKTFIYFLREVRQRTLAAFENQDYQFEDLVDRVVKKREPNRNPLFDVMFAYQKRDASANQESTAVNLKQNPYRYEKKTAKFDLLLSGIEKGNRIFFTFEYCTKIFKEDTINIFIKCFKEILQAVIENPGIKIKDIPTSHHLMAAQSTLPAIDFEF